MQIAKTIFTHKEFLKMKLYIQEIQKITSIEIVIKKWKSVWIFREKIDFL